MREECRILIVDDEELCRDSVARQLSHLGYACAGVESAQAALDALGRNDFDVILI